MGEEHAESARVMWRHDRVVVTLADDLTARWVADARAVLAEPLARLAGRPLLLDLSAVTSVDAAGLGLLLEAHRRAGRVGGALQVLYPPDSLRRALARTRLDRVLACQSRADASRTSSAAA